MYAISNGRPVVPRLKSPARLWRTGPVEILYVLICTQFFILHGAFRDVAAAFPFNDFGDCSAALGDIGGSGGTGSLCTLASALKSFPLRNVRTFPQHGELRLAFWISSAAHRSTS
jgi:hypothetical protein